MRATMERVIRIVKPLAALEVENVTEATRIIDDFDVASADLVDIVLELEEEFFIRSVTKRPSVRRRSATYASWSTRRPAEPHRHEEALPRRSRRPRARRRQSG